jgi:hypothetical protein
MRLTPPAMWTWLIALILGVLGLLVRTGSVHLGLESFWLVVTGWLLLVIACLVKGL